MWFIYVIGVHVVLFILWWNLWWSHCFYSDASIFQGASGPARLLSSSPTRKSSYNSNKRLRKHSSFGEERCFSIDSELDGEDATDGTPREGDVLSCKVSGISCMLHWSSLQGKGHLWATSSIIKVFFAQRTYDFLYECTHSR